jgi:hypothetical protein
MGLERPHPAQLINEFRPTISAPGNAYTDTCTMFSALILSLLTLLVATDGDSKE